MSGHSKWAGIKHKKAIVDAKRGQAFTKVAREITIAAKEGGGGTLGESNSVAWMFERKGVLDVDAGKQDPDEVSLAAIEAGAEDIQVEGKSIEIATRPNDFEKVRQAVEAQGVKVENAELTMQPKTTVAVEEDKAPAVLRLMEALEEDDDVQQVYANFDIPADVLERVSAQV